MARVYLDARACATSASGVGRYCSGLIPELTSRASQHEFVIIGPPATAALATSPNARHVAADGMSTLPVLLSARQLRGIFASHGNPDLYHALFHLVPFGLKRRQPAPARVIVTLHDLIWIDFARQVEPTALAAAWRQRLASTAIPYALRTADHVICNSGVTAAAAERWVPHKRRSVVHLGVGDEFFTPARDADGDNSDVQSAPYIAAFGVEKAYKNIACLVRAFAHIRRNWPQLRLVLIGGDGAASREIDRAGVRHAVDISRGVSDREMRALVRRARALVVPSIVEGFGLPVVEAMALGTPVVISTAPALIEVAGDAALHFDAANPSSLVSVVSRLLADEQLQRGMAALGRARAASFTWRRAADETRDVYEQVLHMNEPSRAAAS